MTRVGGVNSVGSGDDLEGKGGNGLRANQSDALSVMPSAVAAKTCR